MKKERLLNSKPIAADHSFRPINPEPDSRKTSDPEPNTYWRQILLDARKGKRERNIKTVERLLHIIGMGESGGTQRYNGAKDSSTTTFSRTIVEARYDVTYVMYILGRSSPDRGNPYIYIYSSSPPGSY